MATNLLQPFQRLSDRLTALEQQLFTPLNAVRFLVVRCLLMVSMLLTFWWLCRSSL